MKLGVPMEPEGETRVGIVPTSMKKLLKAGFEVVIETGAGRSEIITTAPMKMQVQRLASREEALACDKHYRIRFPGVDGISEGANWLAFPIRSEIREHVKAA